MMEQVQQLKMEGLNSFEVANELGLPLEEVNKYYRMSPIQVRVAGIPSKPRKTRVKFIPPPPVVKKSAGIFRGCSKRREVITIV